MSQARPTIKERWWVGRQFLTNVPCVLQIAMKEARRTIYGEPVEAIVLPFSSPDLRRTKKLVDAN